MAALRDTFSRLLKPRTEAIGLEIGTSAIKVVELRPGATPTLSSYGSRAVPPELLQDGMIVDPGALAYEIQELLKETGITRRFVIAAVGNQQVVTRNIRLPNMPLQELGTAVRFEADKYLPFSIDDVAFDYHLLDDPKSLEEGEEIEVLIAAAQMEYVAQQAECLLKAGLEPVAMDIKPFALMRPLWNGKAASGPDEAAGEGVHVLIESGASSTSITLVRGGRVLLNRVIGVAGDDLTSAVQREFSVAWPEALMLKHQLGAATTEAMEELAGNPPDIAAASIEDADPGRVWDALRPVLLELTGELSRSLQFFTVQAGELELESILLSGGSANLRGMPEAIANALGYPVELANPWSTVRTDSRKFSDEQLREEAAAFAVPLGLAIRGVAGVD